MTRHSLHSSFLLVIQHSRTVSKAQTAATSASELLLVTLQFIIEGSQRSYTFIRPSSNTQVHHRRVPSASDLLHSRPSSKGPTAATSSSDLLHSRPSSKVPKAAASSTDLLHSRPSSKAPKAATSSSDLLLVILQSIIEGSHRGYIFIRPSF